MKKIIMITLFSLSSTIRAETLEPSTVHQNLDVNEQAEGNYPELNRKESLPIGAIQHAWDDALPGAGVYRVPYDPKEIIKFVTREFMTTTIEFPAFENITKVIIGDQSNYQVTIEAPNIVLVRPMGFVGLDSSITLIGESGHVYGFYVRTEGYNSKKVTDIKVEVIVAAPKFTQSQQKGVMANTPLEKTDYLEAVSFDPANLDFNFEMRGDKTIAPVRVYTDGVRTWFDYGDNIGSKTLPSVFIVLDNIDTPVMTSREGTRLVAQGVGNFALKSGNKITCVNKTNLKKNR